jgi:acyl-coenzyme A thioesterase PaaI-like protein
VPVDNAIAVPLGIESDGRVAHFELTGNARGPWDEHAAHGGAPAALLVRAIEQIGADTGMRPVSLQAAFLGPVMLGPVAIETELLKPGRKQMVVSARLTGGGRTLIAATGVLLRRGDVELPAGVDTPDQQPMPPRSSGREVTEGIWAGSGGTAFHRTSNRIVVVTGGPEDSRAEGAAWFRLDCPVVPGESPSPAQRAAAAADFGNGLAHPVPFGGYVFVNCDLNLWLLREPVGEWIGVSSETEVSPNGSGLTTTALHDETGRFGAAGQVLYVDAAG